MPNIIQERLNSLLHYLESVINLGMRTTCDIYEHNDFILFQNDLPSLINDPFDVDLKDNDYWLTIKKVTPSNPPEIPEELIDWVRQSDNPHKHPKLIENIVINDEDQYFYDSDNRQNSYLEFLNRWEKWSDNNKSKYDVQQLFIQLFRIHERLKYDEQIEFVLGQGIIVWDYNHKIIKHPVIVQRITTEYIPDDGIIHICLNDDVQPKIEFEFLNDLNLPDLSDLKNKFTGIEYDPNDCSSISHYLKEIAGRISPEGNYMENSKSNTLQAKNNLQVFNSWVVYIRKRKQDAILNDVKSFIHLLSNSNYIDMPGGIENILLNPDENDEKWKKPADLNEWDILLENNIYFPLPANKEQIKILNYLDSSNGVVVWGPPGTGKSHTITNLICHFMAEGKRVLVTTLKDQALSVLHNMIPDEIKSLCMIMLRDVHDSRDKLEKAVSYITEIITNTDEHDLENEINDITKTLDRYTRVLQSNKNDMLKYASIQCKDVLYIDGTHKNIVDLSKCIYKEKQNHKWLDDDIDYDYKYVDNNDKNVIEIISEPPFNKIELDNLKNIRENIINYLDDLSKDISFIKFLHEPQELSNIVRDIKIYYDISGKINDIGFGLFIKTKDNSVVNNIITDLQVCIEYKNYINEPWNIQLLNCIRCNVVDSDYLEKFIKQVEPLISVINDLYDQTDLTNNIKLPQNVSTRVLPIYIRDTISRLRMNKRPWAFIDFDRKKINALKNIKINELPPDNIHKWKKIYNYVCLMNNINDVIKLWNDLPNRWNIPKYNISGKITMNDITTVLSLYKKIEMIYQYEKVIYPKMRDSIKESIIIGENKIIEDNLEKIKEIIELEVNRSEYEYALQQLEKMNRSLRSATNNGNIHQIVYVFLELGEKAYYGEIDILNKWNDTFDHISKLAYLNNYYKEFKDKIAILSKFTPKWAAKWRDPKIESDDLYPSYWYETWKNKAYDSFLKEMAKNTTRINELQVEQDKYIKDIKKLKGKLINLRVKLKIKKNTRDEHVRALHRWSLAVRRYGKGKGKYAGRKQKLVQKEMKAAKDAVPVWIMPLYKISETIPHEFGNFDVVIVDEASQCDIRSIIALLRGKKVIVVGDPEQISPDSVGISDHEVHKLINQYLKDIPGSDHFNLKSGLYDLAQISFSSKGSIMLTEHFRCVPEIIKFCNDNFYQGRIIPLRNQPPAQRLEPILECIYVEGGYREGRQDLNKIEAHELCEKIKSIVGDPKYKGKTLGVISLTGYAQAKYIFNIIDKYLTPEQINKSRFRVGDAYAFQGDERDIILLSMVVGNDDEKRFTSLVGNVYRQRFNVAVSRARDKLILFHSVSLDKLHNPEDMRYKLLNYMINGQISSNNPKDIINKFESSFEQDVYKWLVNRGYEVTPQVEFKGYRIDLVVEGIDSRLAVECDGDRYHTPDRWWDDQLRQKQLERAGWTFFRVWGSSFYYDADKAMVPILDVLTDLKIYPRQRILKENNSR